MLIGTNLTRDVMSNVHLLIIEQHAINSLDSAIGGLGTIIVNESISLRIAMLIGGNLARENGAESSKSVMKSLNNGHKVNFRVITEIDENDEPCCQCPHQGS